MSFAYLFERFPTFTQTFCVREVAAVRDLAGSVPVFSIRRPQGEPAQDFPASVQADVFYLPDDIEAALRKEPAPLREKLRRLWRLRKHAREGDRKRIFEALWLGPELKRRGVRHVHVHFAGIAARTAWWLKSLHGITYSITAHANDIFVGANEKSPVTLDHLFEDAAFVATVSDYSRGLLAEKFPAAADRIHRVYNGIEPERFAGESAADEPPLILGVGRYIEKKGFRYLIEACSLLPDLALRCRIVGEGPLEQELLGMIKDLGQEGRVSIDGPLPESEIIRLLGRCSVFVLPCVRDSRGDSDNLPTVIMEAMAAGVPVISTPVAGVPEMVRDGVTGFLVAEHDAAGLADAIRLLLTQENVRRKLATSAAIACRELFDVRRTGARLHSLLANV